MLRANTSMRATLKERKSARGMMNQYVTTQKERKSESQNFAKDSENLSALRIRKVFSVPHWLLWTSPSRYISDYMMNWLNWPAQPRQWLWAVRDQQQRSILTAWDSTMSWRMSIVMIVVCINMWRERTDLSSVQVISRIRLNLKCPAKNLLKPSQKPLLIEDWYLS